MSLVENEIAALKEIANFHNVDECNRDVNKYVRFYTYGAFGGVAERDFEIAFCRDTLIDRGELYTGVVDISQIWNANHYLGTAMLKCRVEVRLIDLEDIPEEMDFNVLTLLF